ncbi:MAG: ABC transporter permease subunit [Planctomycetota bacterium]|nr:ABC transporter permease subunit [Planctomycetota bacterium]
MRALTGIILNTFRESVRRPFFYLLLAAGAAALVVTMYLPLFTFHSDVEMYKDLGLSFVLLFALLTGLLAAATGIAREVEDKTAHTILAKAVGRWKFVLGKYLGAMGAVALATLVLGAIFVGAVYYRVQLDSAPSEHEGHSHGAASVGAFGAEATAQKELQWRQAATVVPGLVLVLLQVGVLAAVATALSTRLSPAASVGLSLAAFVGGHLTAFLASAGLGAGWGLQAVAEAVTAAMPFLEIFNINQFLSHAVINPMAWSGPWAAVWAYVGWSALYAAVYAAVAIGAGVLAFRRRALS